MLGERLLLIVVSGLLATLFFKLSMTHAILLQIDTTERFNDDSLEESYVIA